MNWRKKKKQHASISFSIWSPPGNPISILDGIPIAIKDEIDCSPYPTTGNSTCFGIPFTMHMFSGYERLDMFVKLIQIFLSGQFIYSHRIFI